jgi:adenosylmethionine-8-amino-7-oxononanoate aminotransferase
MKRLEAEPLLAIARAQGPWLIDADGRRYLDAVSSWWVNLFGHGHPRMKAALASQFDTLDHVMLAGLTHEPVVELSERLGALTGLGHAFYASDGASATEIALKMSAHAWRNVGRAEKSEFVGLAGGYHGETVGALSVTDIALFREAYAPLLRLSATLPSPDTRLARAGENAAACARRCAATLEAHLEQHHARTAALIVEPLVQCAAGFGMHDAEYLRLARALCDRYQVHLICDEIAVGFGRTGRLFASSWAGVTPDFLCLSKGLAGVMPLAAVLIRAGFEDDFTGAPARSFLHSHTFTGNPIACAAALAGLRLFADTDLLARLPARAAAMAARREAVAAACPAVLHHRQIGMIAAFQVDPARAPADGRLGLRLRAEALRRGVLLRPLHDTIYWLPPLVIDDDELDLLAGATIAAIHAALD